MRALVVGAGAVGQVYGHHLARGGARVSVFVRNKYAADARRGFDLIRIHSRRDRVPARFVPDEVLTTSDEVASRSFRQIWLTVATPALVGGELDALLAASGDATVVCLQPGMSVQEYLARAVPRARTVFGTIGMQSYAAPLKGSEDPIELATSPGTAYFFPPLASNAFGGPEDRARSVVDALRTGGAPAAVTANVVKTLATGSATLIPLVAGLEVAGWSFDAFRMGDEADLAARAAREAMRIVGATFGSSSAPLAALVRGPVLGLVARVARAFAPLDIEAFLRYHFLKVGDQTRYMLSEYVRTATKHELGHAALDELIARLG